MNVENVLRGDLNTLLVGTSLGPESDALVADALGLARALGARLRLAHAILPPVVPGGDLLAMNWVSPEVTARYQAEVRAELAAQAARVGVRAAESGGLAVGLAPAHRMLVEEASEAHADLIVVGASERRGGAILGSTADRVMRKATCPVLVRRGSLRLPLRQVVLGVDLSPPSADAYRFSRTFLAALGGADPEVAVTFVVSELLPGQLPPQFGAERVRRFAAEELERFVAASGGLLPNARLRVLEGEAADEIARAATDAATDLVVVGTHGRSGFERYLAGSVAAEVVRASPCSVLVVPPRAAKSGASANTAAA